jgi:drug/metabolite transporter (DMT)-like permease
MNRILLLLGTGILFASSSSILIRSAETHPLVTATYRMGMATLVMLALARIQHGPLRRVVKGHSPGPILAAGLFLGVHFASWMTSLSHTSVASSVLIVDSSPLLVAVLSYRYLGERLTYRIIAGIFVSMAGALVIVYNDVMSSTGYLGMALAGVGAVCLACYLVIGRRMRTRMPLLPYVASVYGVAFLAILAIAIIAGKGIAPGTNKDIAIYLALALGPSCFGHTVYNHAMKHVSATMVSTAIIAEPVGASMLAAIFLNEVPTALIVAGGALILCGIALVARNPRATT